MSAHPPLALAAATLVAFVLLLRWGATPRPRSVRHHDGIREPRRPDRPGPGRPGSGPVAPRPVAAGAEAVRSGGRGRPGAPNAGARGALRDAERHLSAHWERLRPLYPHVSDTAAPRHPDR
ncbi:hypothetical protein [Streptomyces sp. LUP30]|uniref:hypothetical protein n=1 Tax=Streptomyces sp. LUP30 TaxID=1890285 RepID=UPI0008519B13|nr:hypothetical protein [Streptomyces sp. LUP30]